MSEHCRRGRRAQGDMHPPIGHGRLQLHHQMLPVRLQSSDASSLPRRTKLVAVSANTPSHVESRTDQYVAAFRFTSSTASVTTAYLARAVTPGTFVQPGATVEE